MAGRSACGPDHDTWQEPTSDRGTPHADTPKATPDRRLAARCRSTDDFTCQTALPAASRSVARVTVGRPSARGAPQPQEHSTDHRAPEAVGSTFTRACPSSTAIARRSAVVSRSPITETSCFMVADISSAGEDGGDSRVAVSQHGPSRIPPCHKRFHAATRDREPITLRQPDPPRPGAPSTRRLEGTPGDPSGAPLPGPPLQSLDMDAGHPAKVSQPAPADAGRAAVFAAASIASHAPA